jgi:predicted transcriptional regulator YheO
LTSEEKIHSFLPLVDFFAEISGPNSEVVLHDVRNKEHSLVAIRNGGISGREVGSPMSMFAMSVLRKGTRGGEAFITNYLGGMDGSGKFLKSSTFFIRDDDGEIIGMLGINTDLSNIVEVHRILGQILAVDEIAVSEVDEKGGSIRETVLGVVDRVIEGYGADPSRMTTEEKKEAVDTLNQKGVFLLKGIVAEVASRLDVSEQTIYRYLR